MSTSRLTTMRLGAAALGLLALAGCGGSGSGRMPYDGSDPNAAAAGLAAEPGRFYAPPGDRRDPWGPYVVQAAARFDVPAQWVRAVMRQESGGQQQAVSSAGAIGLMQLMPATYGVLRTRYGLGGDPFEPRDNILAGTAYLREMYDRFGAPAFLAAYNAGPDRVDSYLSNGDPLPNETVGYLTAIVPNLGPGTAMTGPLAVYAGNAPQAAAVAVAAPTPRSLASGCDPDSAYDPDRPCRELERAAATANRPPAASSPVAASRPGWAIQVGAFQSEQLARAMAERAQGQAPDLLGEAVIDVPTTTPFGGQVLYRARLAALSATLASLACQRLNARQLPCIVVRPGTSA